MSQIYLTDAQGCFTEAALFDPLQAIPRGAVFVEPPVTSGAQVAQWTGDGWRILPDAPVPVPDTSQHWEAIKAARDLRAQTGGYQAAGKWFHSDTFSRTQQMGLVLLGANIPANLQWKTMDGSFVTMTQTLAGQVFAAAAASDAALFARAEQIKAIMESDPAGFDLASHAWPPVFGE